MDKDCLIRNTVRIGSVYKYSDGSLWEVSLPPYPMYIENNYYLVCFGKGAKVSVGQNTYQNKQTLAKHWIKQS